MVKAGAKGAFEMKTVAIINLKGGVAKTTAAVSLAELLAGGQKRKRPGSRVLLFDNDKRRAMLPGFLGI